MILRLVVLVSLGCLATAGPITWDDSKCAQYCPENSKYQYSPGTKYSYSYTSSNELQADRTSELTTKFVGLVTITFISKCEAVLQVSNVQTDSLRDPQRLERHPMPFAFIDGKIEHVCPNPEDSDEINNIKKAILSTFQNTMRSFEMNSYNTDTDFLGKCDTSYEINEVSPEKYEVVKTTNVPSCSNHLKGQTLLLASLYESSSHRQHLPFLSDEKASCRQTIDKGVIKQVACEETAFFKPLSDYGYVVKAIGQSKLKKLAIGPSEETFSYRAPKKESLMFKYQAHSHKNPEAASEAREVLRHICEHSADLISKEAASYVHKLVYTIRQMDTSSVESIYNALKNNEICSTGKKAMSIYLDALRMASSGGSIALLSKLSTSGEISKIDSIIWFTLMPFTSYVEEESIASLLPLLRKDVANRQTLLGTTAMAFKYCSLNPDCESTQAIKDLSSTLKQFLGNKCATNSQDEETEVLTALKAFGNLGYFGEAANDIFDCALTATNKMSLRVAAIDAFRRSPCTEETSSKLLEIYKNKNEHDELRIAALISLAKCNSREIMQKVVDAYQKEESKQVSVFTWSLLENIRTSQDPAKSVVRQYLEFADYGKPDSTDMTKFSRNFDLSLFSSVFNLGIAREANLIHSVDSFIPKSGSIAYKLNAFGNQLQPLEVGARVEDLEHILEKIFGPVGILSKIDVEELIKLLPIQLKRSKRSAESYDSKINALHERIGYQRNKVPHGSAFVRIMGHELGLLHLNEESLKRVAGFKPGDMLKNLADLRDIDVAKNLLYLDVSVLFPSITGRAYKLASNGSLTVGLKAQGKIDFKSNSPIPEVDIDGKFKPSLLAEVTASFTIHSEDYEPGVKVETVLSAGLDYQAKLQIKDGRLMHIKLTRERQRSEILNLKRTLYYMNQRGVIEMEKPPSYNFNYCTKYLQKLTGAKVCGSLMFPHAFDNGKFKIPFVRELEASIVVEQTDPSMDGYELLLEIPDFGNKQERRFRILADTPNSARDRKFSIEYIRKMPDENSCSLTVNLHTPFYTLDANGHMTNRDDIFRLNFDVTGDGKRRYSLNIDSTKVIKGARLVEYQPKVTLSLPSTAPMEFTGTLVFSKGRKAQLQVNMESRSFSSPFTIKGNLAKEGDSIDLSSNWKLNYEFNVNAFTQIHRFHVAIGYDVKKGMYFDGAHHYEPDGRSYESVTFNAKIDNIKIFDRLSFSLDSQILFAEHQDLNTMLKWDFSFKPLHHLKNDLIFRYGENFEDDTHLVRLTFVNALHGDFNSFHKFGIENKAGLTISCLDFHKSASLSVVWDFIDDPKFIIEAGIKTDKDKEIAFDFNYRHLEKSPLKLATDFTFTYNTYKFKYRDEAIEVAPREFQWKAVIEPTKGKEITTDFMYRIKNQDDFHHELEGTIQFPGFPQPVKQKGLLQFSERQFKLYSNTDFGRGAFYEIHLKLERENTYELTLNMPFIEGNLVVDGSLPERSVQADFRSKGKDNRRIILSGKVSPGDTNTLDLDVQWDADKDPEQKVTIHLSSSKETEEGIEKYIIGGSINYINTIDISGSISTDLIKGPHFFRAEFSGNVEPMAVEIEHEIKDGHMNSVIRYLRSGVEKIKADIKGKLIIREYSHFEIEGEVITSSPYKTFDGKSLFFRLMADSADETRTFVSEYRLKFSPVIGYEGKLDYQRKRGWPGTIKSDLLVTVHNRPLYEGNMNVDYGNGKYSSKISFTPITKKKIHFLTSFEHDSYFAAFHHSLTTNLQLLQTVDLNAVADLRNMEDAKIHSNMDVNSHKLYDVNSTLKVRSIVDFDIEATVFSKITPSLKMFSKTQASGQVSKFDFNLNIDSKDVITGSGEMKKKKRGFSSDMVFKYKEKEILGLIVQQDGKGKHERNYLIKARFPSRLYTANIKVNKEKKGTVNYETKFCRNEELCINVDATHKEYDNTNEWQITYKRGEIEFGIERIRESSKNVERFHTVIYKGENRFGYDVRFGTEKPGKSLSLGIILPSREIVIKGTAEFSLSKPRIKLDFSSDARRHPDRKLSIDIKFENHLMDNNPSKLDIVIAHNTFEKPIEIKLSGDYEPSSSEYFTAEGSMDYSNDPEDKLIGKLRLVQTGISDQMFLNIYHKDEQHLDFVIKLNATSLPKEETFNIVYKWKDENDADVEAYMTASYLGNENRIFFVYHRPTISYSLDGKIKPSDNLLNNTCEIDLESVYNGKTSKGKLVSDFETGCHKLTIINDEDELSRTAELCINFQSRKFLSLISEGLDDEGAWAVQYLLEIVQEDFNTIRFRQQVNPEFLGSTLFLLTSFVDELEEAGVGKIPFYDSPRFKIIRQSFSSKVWDPFKAFVVPEADKFGKDIILDAVILQRALMYYYSTLPSFDVVKENVMAARSLIRSIAKEVWSNIYSYYENYIRTILQYVEKAREIAQERCENNVDCRSLLYSYQTGGWKGLLAKLRAFILSIPDKIQHFIENPSVEVRNYFRSVSNILKALLQPLTKYRCGEIVVKVAQLSYEFLQPRVQAFLNRVPSYYSGIKQRIAANEYIQLSFGLLKQGYLTLREEILSIDYQKIVVYLRKYIEDRLASYVPPRQRVSLRRFDIENGVIDFYVHDAFTTKVLRLIGEGMDDFLLMVEKSVGKGVNYNWNALLIKLKRVFDLDFIPPYDAQAVFLGHQHFVTFDNYFYDFAGECSYLLTRDFQDGNFTLVLKPKEGDEPASILVLRGDTSVELTSGRTSVKVAENAVQLPYITKHMTVTREGHTIVANTKNGLQVKCNLVHEICTFKMSGWYYGKTAGLLGIYNYEWYDDLKRPKGQIANSINVFAKSWELKKGCKTNNLLPEFEINENADYYKLCKTHFMDGTSPLAACFDEVHPLEHFNLCLRYLSLERDQQKGLCSAAVAYVAECEKRYVELSLPSTCLKCDAPDGSKLEHGDRKKFEKLNKKSADVVFIVEDHDCNKVLVKDLGNFARSIERELQNEGFRENMFGVVGYGGDIGEPQIFTAKDKIFFGSRDVNTIADMFKLESKKVHPSRAFEAIKHAVTHLTKGSTAKSFVLLSCSLCKYDYTSLQYPVVQQILLERGIGLHVIKDNEIPIRKSSVKEKNIIGVDPDTVFYTKDVTQKDLVGEPDLRSQVIMPKDLCIALSQDVNGSFFSTHPISKASSTEVKNFRSVFARKLLKSTQIFSCQWCDCTSTRDHVPNTVCQPCEIKRPRLPFSVGSSSAHTRTLETFIAYLIHMIRE